MLVEIASNPDAVHLSLTQIVTFLGDLPLHISSDSWVLAQQFQQDIVADIRNGFQQFVDSGQVWALLIGLVVGYLFNSLTRFG